MAKFKKLSEVENVFEIQFMCPGCNNVHTLNNTWKFNGDYNNPTVSPSVLVRADMWDGEDKPPIKFVCHSFIKDGKIQFLNDCTHKLKGQTVELPDL